MNKETRIEKMATVLRDRIVNNTWRAEKVAKELYEIAVSEDYDEPRYIPTRSMYIKNKIRRKRSRR